jgi:hypothetical protein
MSFIKSLRPATAHIEVRCLFFVEVTVSATEKGLLISVQALSVLHERAACQPSSGWEKTGDKIPF